VLIKSGIVTQMSGSIGGLTGSHNRGGLYFRARAIPVNPNTTFQQAVRSYLATLTSVWNNILTPAERDAWASYADQVPITGPLGDARVIGALPMYLRCNVSRLQAALDRVDSGPTEYNLGEFTQPLVGVPSEAAQNVAIGFDDTDEWVDEDGSSMLVYVSRPVNQTINYFKGPYRLAGQIDGDSGTPPTSPATINLPFTVAQGQKVFVKINVTRADGRYSSPFRDGVTVGA